MVKYHEAFFDSALYTSYILYLVAFFKIETYDPKYLDMLENIIKYYVIGFLLIRFNPFTTSSFTEFDRKVVFSSAVFLLTTTTISQYGKNLDTVEFIKALKIFK
tara:strand:- start:135 stop:446 length:312 start_codon:yes stop_codon:yes gene_type:complete